VKDASSEPARFAREWNLAFGLVAAGGALLLAFGHSVAGALAIGLGVAAFVARRKAMRREGRGFYGQRRHPR
jgi:hypothetical protein